MATNRYDTPAQYNPINTYVPIPFQEMMQVVDYNKKSNALAQANILDMQNVKLGDLREEYRLPNGRVVNVAEASGANAARQKRNDLDKSIDKLTQQNLDYSRSGNQGVLTSMSRDIARAVEPTGEIGKANINAKKFAMMDEYMNKNPEISQSPWLANAWIEEVDRFSREGGELNINTPIGKFVDRSKESVDLLSKIDSEMSKDPALYRKGRREVSEDKIKQTFLNLFPQSNMARDIQAEARYNYLEDIRNKVTPEKAAENLKDFITNSYTQLETGLVNNYRSSTEPVGSNSSGGWGNMLKGLDVYDTDSIQTPVIKISNIKDIKNPSSSESGNNFWKALVRSGTTTAGGQSTSTSVNEIESGHQEAKSQSTNYAKNIVKAKELLNVSPSTFKTDKEFETHFNNAIDGLNNQSLTLKGVNKEATQQNTEKILSNRSSTRFYIPNNKDTKGAGESVSYDSMLDELGLTGEQFEAQMKKQEYSSFALDGPEPGMAVYEFAKTDGGEPRYVFMSTGKQFTKDTEYAHKYAVKARTLDNTPFIAGYEQGTGNPIWRRLNFYLDDKTDVISHVIEEYVPKDINEKVSYKDNEFPKEKLSEFQPKIIDGRQLTIDDINQQTYKSLKDTPIPGFNFNFYSRAASAPGPMNVDPRMLMMMQMFMQSMQGNNSQYAE